MIKGILKIFFRLLIILVLLLVALFFFLRGRDFSSEVPPQWGVTISTVYAKQLGLDPKKLFHDIIADLGVKKIRIPLYWQDIEISPGEYDWSLIKDFLLEAEKNNVKVILVLGRRQPRWPECHSPSWLREKTEKEMQKEILRLIKDELQEFKDYPAIEGWQVENEPLLRLFGKCPSPDQSFLKEEMKLVRENITKPLIITDSGELSLWLRTSPLTEKLGTTMYRVVWNPLFGFWDYDFVPPGVYTAKAFLVKKLYPNLKDVIISELQAEPWVPDEYSSVVDMPLSLQQEVWSEERFRDTLQYARQTGFQEIYLWGVEWWYWMKEKNNNSEYWEIAKELFSEN